MKKIVEYKVVEGTYKTINDVVNSLIADGWEPHGSVTVLDGDLNTWFYQPMVLRKMNSTK